MAYYQQMGAARATSPSTQEYENYYYSQPSLSPVSQVPPSFTPATTQQSPGFDAAYKEAEAYATKIACSLQSPQNFRRLAWALGIIVGIAVIIFFVCGVRASRTKSQIIDTRNKVCPNVRLTYQTCEDDFSKAVLRLILPNAFFFSH